MDITLTDHNGNPYPNDWPTVRAEVAELIGLVGISEIAEKAGVQANTVKVWRQRHDDFPEPLAQLKMGPVWSWTDVEPWVSRQLEKTGKTLDG